MLQQNFPISSTLKLLLYFHIHIYIYIMLHVHIMSVSCRDSALILSLCIWRSNSNAICHSPPISQALIKELYRNSLAWSLAKPRFVLPLCKNKKRWPPVAPKNLPNKLTHLRRMRTPVSVSLKKKTIMHNPAIRVPMCANHSAKISRDQLFLGFNSHTPSEFVPRSATPEKPTVLVATGHLPRRRAWQSHSW